MTLNGGADQFDPAVIVNLRDGSVSTVIKVGSMLVQGEPDDWREASDADPQLPERAALLAASVMDGAGK